MIELFQCPYDIAVTCSMEESCLGCEDFKPIKAHPNYHKYLWEHKSRKEVMGELTNLLNLEKDLNK